MRLMRTLKSLLPVSPSTIKRIEEMADENDEIIKSMNVDGEAEWISFRIVNKDGTVRTINCECSDGE